MGKRKYKPIPDQARQQVVLLAKTTELTTKAIAEQVGVPMWAARWALAGAGVDTNRRTYGPRPPSSCVGRPPKSREAEQVVLLAQSTNLTTKAIAKRVGIAQGTARRALMRAGADTNRRDNTPSRRAKSRYDTATTLRRLGATLARIGKVLGVTPQRARQILHDSRFSGS
jgi:transposase-like protein